MLRLENVSPEEMPEVVRIASELYERDQGKEAQDQERQAYVDAAEEVGLPEEYLHRAAAELQIRRAEQIRLKRRRRQGLLAVLAAVGALAGLWQVTHRPPPPPIFYTFQASGSSSWGPNINAETQATVTFDNGVATIHVTHFGAPAGSSNYYANLDTSDVPPTLTGYHTVQFQAQGTGLASIRLYLENGPTERWRSPALPLTNAWQTQTVPLSAFDYQTRAGSQDVWRRQSYQPPGHVERLSFKVGTYVNPIGAQGDASVRDLSFK
ncbi:MAG TPA: hypothetical protein VKT32_13835 [Chthonomonadaceae bacterium]|nr:hypothetical protein [Chthonomonadaceae bacterium]